MSLIINVISVNIDGPRKEAQRLETIIGQERAAASVTWGMVMPDILRSWGVTQVPVFRINDVTVWEGETPPGDVVRSWLHWPKSLDEAAERILSSVDNIPEGPDAHLGLGVAIRNSFGLWGANKDLLRSCGSESMSADDASDIILNKAREIQKIRRVSQNK